MLANRRTCVMQKAIIMLCFAAPAILAKAGHGVTQAEAKSEETKTQRVLIGPMEQGDNIVSGGWQMNNYQIQPSSHARSATLRLSPAMAVRTTVLRAHRERLKSLPNTRPATTARPNR